MGTIYIEVGILDRWTEANKLYTLFIVRDKLILRENIINAS